jgi:two-component system sensor histidine kinase RegB
LFDLKLQVGLASATVSTSIVANLISSFLYLENRRLTEREATLMLSFDVLQLALLLYLTGGLNNPFAVLLLAPVTIAATVLHLRSTILLGGATMFLVSLLAFWSLPMLTPQGIALELPGLFLFGFWLALVTGLLFLSIYARQVTTEIHSMNDALVATQMALAREQKLTDVGGVVAAAAHELGTPLATITLVAAELIDELEGQTSLKDDAALIREQADRCRDILRSMGRVGKDDLHLRKGLIEAVVREAAEPHTERGKHVTFAATPFGPEAGRQPEVLRRPEMVHGLRNLIQNAVDFASSAVKIDVSWSSTAITVRIQDDGQGFPQSVIGRIGDPFMRGRRAANGGARPGYEGMGLGLFIAKTLLERSGANLTFANGGTRRRGHGAIVVVEWPRDRIEQPSGKPLGENQPIRL